MKAMSCRDYECCVCCKKFITLKMLAIHIIEVTHIDITEIKNENDSVNIESELHSFHRLYLDWAYRTIALIEWLENDITNKYNGVSGLTKESSKT